MKKTILVLGGLLPGEMRMLEGHFSVLKLEKSESPERMLEEHRDDIVGIVVTPGKKISNHLIEALPNLELICQFGTGTENIDKETAARMNIQVSNTPDLVTADTADIALMLMLGVARRGFEADMYVRVGKWPLGNMGLGASLTDKTVGILGLGNIGQAIANRAQAFDMNVVYHSRTQKDVPYSYYDNALSLAENSDFLVCATPGGDETHHLVNETVLEALGPKGFLINIARGSVVDEKALILALHNKKLAGAGLDVYEKEPHVPEELLKMDNVVLLPHIGTATFETRTKMGRLVIDNIFAHFEGKPLLTPVAA